MNSNNKKVVTTALQDSLLVCLLVAMMPKDVCGR
jgi:hypothetical protein